MRIFYIHAGMESKEGSRIVGHIPAESEEDACRKLGIDPADYFRHDADAGSARIYAPEPTTIFFTEGIEIKTQQDLIGWVRANNVVTKENLAKVFEKR